MNPVSGREEYLHQLSGVLLRGDFVSFPSFVYSILFTWYELLETGFYSSYSFKAIFPGFAREATDANTVQCHVLLRQGDLGLVKEREATGQEEVTPVSLGSRAA